MADDDIRTLERDLITSPDDAVSKAKLRFAYVRAGRPEDALPVRKGDIGMVTEDEHPWINGSWEGEVMEVLEDGALNIKPTSNDPDFKVQPSPEYLSTGLYITANDSKKFVITVPVSI